MLSAMSSHAASEAADSRMKQKQPEEASQGLTVTRLMKVGDEIISKYCELFLRHLRVSDVKLSKHLCFDQHWLLPQ